jgi:hypothetical protein
VWLLDPASAIEKQSRVKTGDVLVFLQHPLYVCAEHARFMP